MAAGCNGELAAAVPQGAAELPVQAREASVSGHSTVLLIAGVAALASAFAALALIRAKDMHDARSDRRNPIPGGPSTPR